MKKADYPLLWFLILSVLMIGGCKAGQPTSSNSTAQAPAANNNQPPAASADSNSNSTTQQAANSNAKSSGPAQLIGTYEAREIEDSGVVTLMSQIRTLISFSADGTFSRASQAKGKTYHTDSGLFRIEPPDKLVLTIQISKKEIQSPAVVRKHTYSLSADGDQLRLTSEKGKTAVFQRVAKPKQS